MVTIGTNRKGSPLLSGLRIYNIGQEENETQIQCYYKLKQIINLLRLDIPDHVIDRVHRAGVGYNNKPPAMIVRLTTSRHRTKLYRARHVIKERFGYSLQVDLSKERLSTLKKVREIGKEHMEITGFEYAYANINCVMYMKINGRFEKFTTVEEASRLMRLENVEVASDDNTSGVSSGDDHDKVDDDNDGCHGNNVDEEDDDGVVKDVGVGDGNVSKDDGIDLNADDDDEEETEIDKYAQNDAKKGIVEDNEKYESNIEKVERRDRSYSI